MRIPEITRDELAPNQRHIWDEIAKTRSRVAGPFQVLLNHPDLAERVTKVGTLLRYEGNLAGNIRELAIISTAREFDAELEWAAHVPLARKAGVTDQTIAIVRERNVVDGLKQDEATVISFCRELFRGKRVPQHLFQKAQELFGTQGLVELTVLVGYYSMIACCLNAFEVEPGIEFHDKLATD